MRLFRRLVRYMVQGGEESRRTDEGFYQLLSHAPVGGRLLDVGCSQGEKTLRYTEILSVPVADACGIEAQEKYAQIAAGKLKVYALDIEKERFPFADETFETVTCNQVVEHLKNIFLPLSEMERVLKVGGHLALGIPNLAALHNRVLLLFGRQPVCNEILGPHIRCFTHRAFKAFLKANSNFTLIAVNGASLYPLVEYGARFFPGLAAYTFYLLRKERYAPQSSAWHVYCIGDTCL